MADERTRGQVINTWLQSMALVIAALWAGWSFYFDKIQVPESAPVNISLKLGLRKLESKDNKSLRQSLIPIEMNVTATNPSSRTVGILPNAWVAYGRIVERASFRNNTSFQNDVLSVLNFNVDDAAGRYAKIKSLSLIATGKLFSDVVLKPNETISRTLIFYLPENRYDSVAVTTVIPTKTSSENKLIGWFTGLFKSSVSSKYKVVWSFIPPRSSTTDLMVEPKLYRIDDKSKPIEIKSVNGRMVDGNNEFQMSSSKYVLGL